jgi:hypothetical protein
VRADEILDGHFWNWKQRFALTSSFIEKTLEPIVAYKAKSLNYEPYGNKIEKLPSGLATAMTVKE